MTTPSKLSNEPIFGTAVKEIAIVEEGDGLSVKPLGSAVSTAIYHELYQQLITSIQIHTEDILRGKQPANKNIMKSAVRPSKTIRKRIPDS